MAKPADEYGRYTPGRCWLGKPGKNGYICTQYGGTPGKLVHVHRFAFEVLRGPIPDGFALDHLCRQRNCYNPAHIRTLAIRRRDDFGARSGMLRCHRASVLTTFIPGNPTASRQMWP